MRTNEGEAASDLDFELGVLCLLDAHFLGNTFAFGIDVGWIGRAGVCFGNVGDVARLFAVNRAGAGEEEFPGVVCCGELESAGCAFEDGGGHLVGCLGLLLCTSLSGGMNDVVKVAGGEGEGADIALKKNECRVVCKMRALAEEGCRISGKYGDASVEPKCAIDVKEGFGEPGAEETGAPGEKEMLVAHLVPKGCGVFEDVVEVDRRAGEVRPWAMEYYSCR